MKVEPIGVSGHGMTSRGGSAVGGALRRDYAVDERTRLPLTGVAQDPNRVVVTAPVSAGVGWRAVSARPEPPVSSGGGGLWGLFGHNSHTAEASAVRVDGRGNPYVAPLQRPGGDGERSRGPAQAVGQPVGQTNAHTQPGQGTMHSETVQGNSHTQPVQSSLHSQPVQQQSFHAQPSYQAAPHVEMHSSPAVSAPAAAPAAAAPAAAAPSKK